MYYKVYEAKMSQNTESFMIEYLDFFPFELTHVFTDNGLEFNNKLIKFKKGNLCQKSSRLDVICEKGYFYHRLNKPNTPNGMVERVNGTIKNCAILKVEYECENEIKVALISFLLLYLLYRRHGGVRKELNVKTPFNAVEKWFEMKSEIFKQNSDNYKNKILNLQSNFKFS